MLWKCRGAYFKIPLTFAVLFSMFAYCHSKETLQKDWEFLYVGPKSHYGREACFLNYTLSDDVLPNGTAQRYHLHRTQATP